MEEGVSEKGDAVPAHGEEKGGVGEHLRAGGSSGDGHTVTGDLPQATVLSLHRIICTKTHGSSIIRGCQS